MTMAASRMKVSLLRYQHDSIDRRNVGVADHFHHHDSEPDPCGENRQSLAQFIAASHPE